MPRFFDSKSLIALAGAFFLGFYQIVTRNISKHDSNETSLFFSSIIGIILMGIVSIFTESRFSCFQVF